MDGLIGHRDLDVVERCKRCSVATRVAEYVWDLDDDGHERFTSTTVDVPHDEQKCRRFAALMRETWPHQAT